MKVQILESSFGAGPRLQFLNSLLIDDHIAIDAGCIGLISPVSVQKKIQHVFLSHSHVDHISSLPIFLDNVYEPSSRCPLLYASEPVFECLRLDFFNGRVWPDLMRISREETPFFKTQVLRDLAAVDVGKYRITPVALDHVVPVFGFIVEDPATAIGVVCDTCPTDKVWEQLNQRDNLKGLFVEASFPNEMDWLADKSKHLTPQTLSGELAKLSRRVRTIVIHVKPAFHDRTADQIQSLGDPLVEVAHSGTLYEF